MGTLDTLFERLNSYLAKQGLQPMANKPADATALYESALRSVWKLDDLDRRNAVAMEITAFLKKYVGGKNMEALYEKLSQKLDAEMNVQKDQAEKQAQSERLNDPGYVPSFDELFSDDK
ncbi:MAG: hypothetical protein JW822_01965 [Spirochaetales bacterium]|nr:hypothetical protein [Spirochaetales bacterium]